MNRPVFIVGNQKAGTSLLVALLDAHPELFVLPLEVKLFYFASVYSLPPGSLPLDQEERRNVPYGSRRKSPTQVLDEILNSYDFQSLREGSEMPRNIRSIEESLDIDMFWKLVWDRKPNSLRQIYEVIFSSWFDALHTPPSSNLDDLIWVEKTPNQEEYAMKLREWFPDSIFLHVLRNPYANAYSLARGGKWKSIRQAVGGLGKIRHIKDEVLRLMAKSYYFMERNRKLMSNYYVVRYEDIVRETEPTMRSVSDWIGVSFSDLLLEPSIGGAPWGGNSRTVDKEMKGISKKSIDKYKGKISNMEIFLINKYYKKFMREYEYEVQETPSLHNCFKPKPSEGILGYFRNRMALLDDFI